MGKLQVFSGSELCLRGSHSTPGYQVTERPPHDTLTPLPLTMCKPLPDLHTVI